MRRLLALIVGFHLLIAGTPAAPLGILTSSDQHSNYWRLIDWIYTVAHTHREFKKKYPDGVFIINIPGDFNGIESQSTQFPEGSNLRTDFGRTGIEVLAFLSHLCDIIKIPGNHDEFDWEEEERGSGNRLFLEHHSELITWINQEGRQHHRVGPFKLLAANLVPGPHGRDLFQPYSDIAMPDGRKVRFVGGILDIFFSKSSYDRSGKLRLIEDVGPLAEMAKKQVDAAVRDGVTDVVFTIHEQIAGERGLKNMARELDAHIARNPHGLDYSRLRTPIIFGAHEHSMKSSRVDGRLFVQSGSKQDAHFVVLNDAFEIIEEEQFGKNEQAAIRAEMEPRRASLHVFEKYALSRVEARLAEISQGLNLAPLGRTERGFPYVKRDFHKGQSTGGHILANILRSYGPDVPVTDVLRSYGAAQDLPLGSMDEIIDDVAFYNSSSNRLETPILPGTTMTYIEVMHLYGFPSRVAVFVVTGWELNELFRSARSAEAARGKYSPQLSSNLRETEGYQLEILRNEKWEPLQPGGQYRLTTDGFLGQNGPGLEVWETILGIKARKQEHSVHPRMTDLIAKNVGRMDFCPDLLREKRFHHLGSLQPDPQAQTIVVPSLLKAPIKPKPKK